MSDRFAPEFELEIAGSPVPAVLRGSITSVQLQTSLNAAGRVEFALVNESLRWLDHPLLRLDNDLKLSIGYAQEPLARLFAGRIVSQQASFPSGGMPTLSVAAQDRMEKLQQGTSARWFALPITKVTNLALPDTAIAGIVAAENGLVPALDPVGAAISVILGGVSSVAAMSEPGGAQKLVRKQESESDFDFLRRIAAENAWDLMIEHDGPLGGLVLRFFSPLGHLTPDAKLAYGRSLIDFAPRVSNVGQIISVTAYVWVSQIKTRFTVTIGWDWDRAQLTIDIRPQFVPAGRGPSDVLLSDPLTPSSAPRALVGKLLPRLNQRLTASASTIGDPRIRPGAVVQIDGVGEQFGGYYRVTSATHSIDGSGYRTTFDVRKEIWFGSIPLSDQGAVPVHVTAPGLP